MQRRIGMELETFADVQASIKKNAARPFHLLLGNGFSVAFDQAIFSYNALHDFVTKVEDEDLATVLSVVESSNFEVIMQHLSTCSALLDALGGDAATKARIDSATVKLKAGLLDAVKALHPEHVFKVPESQSVACAAFLKLFLDAGGALYSTNYDLLLYWVLLRNRVRNHVDGCGREREDDEEDFVPSEDQVWSDLTWGKHRDSQNIFYLHGALPFFDNGVAILKEEYDTYNFLLEKISKRMDKGEYPIFVTAGDGHQKLTQIRHNQYLNHCYDRLCEIQGSLVCFGFGFGSSDGHIIEAINKAAKHGKKVKDKLWSVYIGVYSPEDKQHIEGLVDKFDCKVHIWDAKTANVWGK